MSKVIDGTINKTIRRTWRCKYCGCETKSWGGLCNDCGYDDHDRLDGIESRLARLENKDKPLINHSITLEGDYPINLKAIEDVLKMLRQQSKSFLGYEMNTTKSQGVGYRNEVVFKFKDKQ